MKKLQIAVIILFSTVLALPLTAEDKAIKRQPSAKGAKVYIVNLKNGRTLKNGKVKVIFGLSGMGVCPAGIITPEGKSPPNTGHHHLLIDMDKLPPMDQPLAASDKLKHFGGGQTEAVIELKPGKHTLQLVFADFAHIPHDPPVVSEKISVTVAAPKKK